jgi:Ca2+/H+ antiporter, TMEM165/GDT1 family
MLEPLLVSAAAVAIAEIGDKSQFLALLLAARYRRFLPVAAGILVAAVVSFTLAGLIGTWLSQLVPDHVLRWLIGVSFIVIGVWMLKPDALDDEHSRVNTSSRGAFATTALVFLVAEMGDKTQIATVLLAARFDSLPMVVIGSTLGILAVSLPVVALGARFADRLPLRFARWAAAIVFATLGVWVLVFS